MVTPILPPITIGIPFYNAEATILDAVRSVFAQTHCDWELILFDDGSTDHSLELAHSINDSRVKVYSDGQNLRLATRLNQIAELASHEHLARMDADDLISPVRIERQLSALAIRPEWDLVSTGVCSLTDEGKPLGVRCVPADYTISPGDLLAGRTGIVHASVVGKRAWFKRNRYREVLRSSEDANLWIRAFSKGDLNMGFVSEPLYYYREDGNVALSKLSTAYWEGLRTIVKDAGPGYSLFEKGRGFVAILARLVAARILSMTDSLDILRNRRTGTALTPHEEEKLLKEIGYVKKIKLPI